MAKFVMLSSIAVTKSDVLRFYSQGESRYKQSKPAEHNLKVINSSLGFQLGLLDEKEFWMLVFVEAPESKPFLTNGRFLKDVAKTALDVIGGYSGSWGMATILQMKARFEQGGCIERGAALILRELSPSEPRGSYYLQDGNKRALAYAMALFDRSLRYTPVPAYLCTGVNWTTALE